MRPDQVRRTAARCRQQVEAACRVLEEYAKRLGALNDPLCTMPGRKEWLWLATNSLSQIRN